MSQTPHELDPFKHDSEQHVKSGQLIDTDTEPLNLQVEKSLQIIGQHSFPTDIKFKKLKTYLGHKSQMHPKNQYRNATFSRQNAT